MIVTYRRSLLCVARLGYPLALPSGPAGDAGPGANLSSGVAIGVYVHVSRDGMRLHLSSHHDDGTPGTAVLVEVRNALMSCFLFIVDRPLMPTFLALRRSSGTFQLA